MTREPPAVRCDRLREALGCEPCELVGESEAHAEMLSRLHLVAARKATVLLVGPSGVGKTTVARVLHRASGRRGRFVQVNAASLAPTLADSLLFGHARGSFTGAEQPFRGLISQADGGTLFIDEIADLDPAVQSKLLTFLDDGRFRGLGLDESAADVRLITATNRDLSLIRSELLARIAQIEIAVPSLAERPGDIRLLAEVLLIRIARSEDPERRVLRLAPDAEAALLARMWPMNVRQLESALLWADIRAFAAGERRIRAEHLPFGQAADPGVGPWEERCAALRRLSLEEALELSGGQADQAARMLGVGRSTVYGWAKELGIDLDEARGRSRSDA